MVHTENKIAKITDCLNEFVRQYSARTEILNGDAHELVNDTQAHILMLLLNTDRSLTNSALAEEMELSKPAVTKAVKGLVLKGYLTSAADKQDKRVVYHRLTENGQLIAQHHLATHKRTMDEFEDIFSNYSDEELKTVQRFMNDLLAIAPK
ncbi:MarR family transcriptional regulator [Periweissella cryptocerci]|uniref:MarR family transcriptional regulator n=1 Tax=Periweissella cryptocerci TaxID=2506420 RepID=A0A4P6YUB5_9LACO|nr:MarR family transcriptional regulator [Periweissella cryptocerci]QBO36330.1 MarR family transcriptional regulator [Periweissella cryptocerci]